MISPSSLLLLVDPSVSHWSLYPFPFPPTKPNPNSTPGCWACLSFRPSLSTPTPPSPFPSPPPLPFSFSPSSLYPSLAASSSPPSSPSAVHISLLSLLSSPLPSSNSARLSLRLCRPPYQVGALVSVRCTTPPLGHLICVQELPFNAVRYVVISSPCGRRINGLGFLLRCNLLISLIASNVFSPCRSLAIENNRSWSSTSCYVQGDFERCWRASGGMWIS